MIPLPTIAGGFKTIAADPPWYFRTRTSVVSDRDPQRHYPVMPLKEISALPVSAIAAPDAHLWLWATGPCLPQAFDVIKAWGFRYSGMGLVWIKLKRNHNPNQLRVAPMIEGDLFVGLGFTTRKNVEYCLLARRGNAKRIAKDVREVIMAPVRRHSQKPDEAYARMERYAAGPRCELFARERRDGWAVWGNEIDDPPCLHRSLLQAEPPASGAVQRVDMPEALADGRSPGALAAQRDPSPAEEASERPDRTR